MRHTKAKPDDHDLLAHLRRPHGILAMAILFGIILWGAWTLMTLR